MTRKFKLTPRGSHAWSPRIRQRADVTVFDLSSDFTSAFGTSASGMQLTVTDPFKMGNQSLTGVFLGAEIANERTRQMIQRHVDDVAAGRLQVLVDRTFPLSEAAAAHAYIESRQAVGRVVLVP